MKRFDLLKILLVALVVTVATTGCRSRTKGLTLIPGSGITKEDTGPKPIYTPKNDVFTPPIIRTAPPPPIGDGGRFPTSPPPHIGNLPPEGNPPPAFPPGIGGLPEREPFDGIKDAEVLKNNTVFFDYDSSVIKDKERGKIEGVAAFLKTSATNKLLVEGHCDERGTEEYNRALGERRALAVREYLIRLGISGTRIRTISYGFDKPLNPAHNEAAWSKNRRGVFIVLMPKP